MLNYKRRLVALSVCLLSFILITNTVYANTNKTTDLIIFSFHRPMQLYALLETIKKYISNINQIYVLYRTDTHEYYEAYQEIQTAFPHIHFVKQGADPRADFKPLLLQCFYGSPAEYIFFAVDDDIVKDYVDINECIRALEKTNAYGFYLRLGTNIKSQYHVNRSLAEEERATRQPSPAYIEIAPGILQYQFSNGFGDWRYPHNLDMTIFKKSKIERYYKNGQYSSPNTLEGNWYNFADLNQYGLFFKTSKKFTLPLNIVQQDWWCPNENSFSVDDLFNKWKNGLKININQFDQVVNNCVFMGYRPNFIERK